MNDTNSVTKKFPIGTLLFLLVSMFLATMGFGITTPVLPFLIQNTFPTSIKPRQPSVG